MHVWSWTSERCMTVVFSAASQCSLYFYGVSMLRYLTASNCDTRPTGLEATTSTLDYVPLLTLPFLCSLLHVHVWMDDCIPVRETATTKPTPSSTQPKTISSPVQVTQPSSTQDSFAKSNGPALLWSFWFSLFVFLCLSSAILSQAGPPLSSLPPWSKDGRWWLGCQRPRRWMGNSHWVI